MARTAHGRNHALSIRGTGPCFVLPVVLAGLVHQWYSRRATSPNPWGNDLLLCRLFGLLLSDACRRVAAVVVVVVAAAAAAAPVAVTIAAVVAVVVSCSSNRKSSASSTRTGV